MDDVIQSRKFNYRRKIKPEAVQDGEVRLNNLAEAIQRARVIVDGLKGNPGWEALKKTYQEKVDSFDYDLSSAARGIVNLPPNSSSYFLQHPHLYKDYLISERAHAIEVRDIVEDMEARIETLERQFSEEKAALNERKQRLRTSEPSQF